MTVAREESEKESIRDTIHNWEASVAAVSLGSPDTRLSCVHLSFGKRITQARLFMKVEATREITFPAILVAMLVITLDFCFVPIELRNLFLDSDLRWFFISIRSPRL